jgi:hypothetical protein
MYVINRSGTEIAGVVFGRSLSPREVGDGGRKPSFWGRRVRMGRRWNEKRNKKRAGVRERNEWFGLAGVPCGFRGWVRDSGGCDMVD